MKKNINRVFAAAAAFLVALIVATPVQAQLNGGGPYGDIDGYYTWAINDKGWTVYSQNGYSWIYDSNGNRVYLDQYGNMSTGVTDAAAKTIAKMNLTYSFTSNGVPVYRDPYGTYYTIDSYGNAYQYGTTPAPAPVPTAKDLVVYYAYTTEDGSTNVYKDVNGNYWYFANGYYPTRWYGSSLRSYWDSSISNKVYRYVFDDSGKSIYKDDFGNQWWFDNSGAHLYSGGHSTGFNPSGKPAETGVDWNHKNTMWVDGKTSVVYVGQYWQAPSYVSWTPDGMKFIGWDYAESTGYVRWKPGQYIKNTGSDLALYPVYSW